MRIVLALLLCGAAAAAGNIIQIRTRDGVVVCADKRETSWHVAGAKKLTSDVKPQIVSLKGRGVFWATHITSWKPHSTRAPSYSVFDALANILAQPDFDPKDADQIARRLYFSFKSYINELPDDELPPVSPSKPEFVFGITWLGSEKRPTIGSWSVWYPTRRVTILVPSNDAVDEVTSLVSGVGLMNSELLKGKRPSFEFLRSDPILKRYFIDQPLPQSITNNQALEASYHYLKLQNENWRGLGGDALRSVGDTCDCTLVSPAGVQWLSKDYDFMRSRPAPQTWTATAAGGH